MAEINLITSNKNKVAEFRKVLEPEIMVNQIAHEYPEMRGDANETIARQAAQALAVQLQKPVVVEDSGFYMDAYDGFPGVYTSTVFKKIGNRGFLKLMVGVADRTVRYKSAIALCEPNGMPHVFSGEEEGILAEEESGAFGWGQDSIFIPKENNSLGKTYGELCEIQETLFRNRALKRLKEYLLGKPFL